MKSDFRPTIFTSIGLVLHPPLIGGFSEFVRVRGQARLAGKGCSLGKRRNAVQGHGQTHPKGVIPMLARGVAALAKGITLNCTPRLAGKHRDSAEPAN